MTWASKIRTFSVTALSCVAVLSTLLLSIPARSDLANPTWFDANWHYRVPITVPANAGVGSTVQFDVDFNSLLGSLNIDVGASVFDINSPRVVRPSGTLVANQEFTDAVFGGVLDALGNGSGQIRFLMEDPPTAGTYYLYFDIVANGVKPANPATVINGHFEHSNGVVPTQWTRSAVNAGGGQDNDVQTTTLGQTMNLAAGCSTGAANGLDVSPNNSGAFATGQRWHLLGYRTNCEDGAGAEQIQLSRTIQVPAGAGAGVLEFYFQVQAFDGISSTTNYDWMVFSVNGVAVNHTSLGIAASPQFRIDTNRVGRNGYGTTVLDFGWKRAQLNLAPYAGSTITIAMQTRHSGSDNGYRSWMKIDDVVWSLQTATLGPVEGFGADNTSAVAFGPGQLLVLSAVVDAVVGNVVVDVYDETSSQVAAGIVLFDDGTHGDTAAGDNIWTNDGSDGGSPTYTFPAGPFGSNWLMRVFALDSSTALGGVTNGLVMIPSGSTAPEDQTNFYNIDDQYFALRGATVDVAKTSQAVRDLLTVSRPAALPKAIPGGWVRYSISVENQGPDALDSNSISIVDEIPNEVAVCVDATCACTPPTCTPGDPVQFDDSASPIATGLNFNYPVSVSYSVDGTDFSYSPTPDAEGFDTNVRYVRVQPAGSMNQPSGSDNAEFDIRLVVRIE